MNTIGLIVLPWLCGLATVLLCGMVKMLRQHISAESVPTVPPEKEGDMPRVGGIAFHWPGVIVCLLLLWPYTWPVIWLIGIPLFSFLRWWIS